MNPHTLKNRQRYYNKAYYLPKGKDIQYRTLIKYQLMAELKKKYSQAIQNMITSRYSTVFVTNYLINSDPKKTYNVGDRIYTGKTNDIEDWDEWYIKNAFQVDFGHNEQAKRVVKDTIGKYWVLELE